MNRFLKDYTNYFKWVWKSRYKWMLILYLLWLYRINFIQENGSGVGKIIQVTTLFGLFFYMNKFSKQSIVSIAYGRSNIAVKSCLLLYTYGVISSLWAYLPQFAFFLAFQNIVLLIMFVW